MKPVFADTYYFLALLNARDAAHENAREYARATAVSTITTVWVLTELADALCKPPQRATFIELSKRLQANPLCLIIPASQALWEEGLALYESRPDKEWSLTDCISFVVMRQRGITEALTGDRHFEQAGFRALL